MKAKFLSIAAAFVLAASLFTGCSQSATQSKPAAKQELSSGSWTGKIGDEEVTINGAYLIDGEEVTVDGSTWETAKANETTFLVVNGGKLNINNATIKKSGASEDTEKQEDANQGKEEQSMGDNKQGQDAQGEQSFKNKDDSMNERQAPPSMNKDSDEDSKEDSFFKGENKPAEESNVQEMSTDDTEGQSEKGNHKHHKNNDSSSGDQNGERPERPHKNHKPSEGEMQKDKSGTAERSDNDSDSRNEEGVFEGGQDFFGPDSNEGSDSQNKEMPEGTPPEQNGKPGGMSGKEESNNFYGLNSAIVCVGEGSEVNINSCAVETDAEGANAVFAAADAKITIDGIKITTKQDSSRGLYATYGGTIEAKDVDISTEGAHCAPLATDRGGGTVTVTGTGNKLNAQGEGSPLVYSTGDISVSGAEGSSKVSQTFVIEGKNKVSITDCDFSSSSDSDGAMIYQSMSGDAADEDASGDIAQASIKNSKLSYAGDGTLFYVTNTRAQVEVDNCEFENNAEDLLKAAAGRWGSEGKNGGEANFKFTSTKLKGNASADDVSSLEISADDVGEIKTSGNAKITQD